MSLRPAQPGEAMATAHQVRTTVTDPVAMEVLDVLCHRHGASASRVAKAVLEASLRALADDPEIDAIRRRMRRFRQGIEAVPTTKSANPGNSSPADVPG